MSISPPDLLSSILTGLRAPAEGLRRGVDGMKMTALSAWAVDTLSRDGADAVQVEWAFGSPRVEISARYVDGRSYSAVGAGKRDFAVMGAVSDIIDVRAESMAVEPMWWEILGIDPSADLPAAERAYLDLVKHNHPDRGGDHGVMVRLNMAREAARADLIAA